MDTGTRRRRAGEWRGLVQEWRKSGETRDAFASARGVKPTTLGWWASELTRRKSAISDREEVDPGRASDVPAGARRRRGAGPSRDPRF